MAHIQTKTALIAAVTHELSKGQKFQSVSDWSEAVKARCAKLRIAYNAEVVTAAMRQVLRTRPDVLARPSVAPSVEGRPAGDELPLSRADAARLYKQVMARMAPEESAEPAIQAPEHFPNLVAVRS